MANFQFSHKKIFKNLRNKPNAYFERMSKINQKLIINTKKWLQQDLIKLYHIKNHTKLIRKP